MIAYGDAKVKGFTYIDAELYNVSHKGRGGGLVV